MTDDRVPRRTFLTSAAATIAGAALVPAIPSLARGARPEDAAASAAPVHEVKLGIASYSRGKDGRYPFDKLPPLRHHRGRLDLDPGFCLHEARHLDQGHGGIVGPHHLSVGAAEVA